jgi:hypothetical protein
MYTKTSLLMVVTVVVLEDWYDQHCEYYGDSFGTLVSLACSPLRIRSKAAFVSGASSYVTGPKVILLGVAILVVEMGGGIANDDWVGAIVSDYNHYINNNST